MAAGAIPAEKGFRFAFQGGADFICAGMFDFQLKEDAKLAKQILAEDLGANPPLDGVGHALVQAGCSIFNVLWDAGVSDPRIPKL